MLPTTTILLLIAGPPHRWTRCAFPPYNPTWYQWGTGPTVPTLV